MCFEDIFTKDDSINELFTKVFVEQSVSYWNKQNVCLVVKKKRPLLTSITCQGELRARLVSAMVDTRVYMCHSELIFVTSEQKHFLLFTLFIFFSKLTVNVS